MEICYIRKFIGSTELCSCPVQLHRSFFFAHPKECEVLCQLLKDLMFLIIWFKISLIVAFVLLHFLGLHLFYHCFATFSALKLFAKGGRRGSSWRIWPHFSSSFKSWNCKLLVNDPLSNRGTKNH